MSDRNNRNDRWPKVTAAGGTVRCVYSVGSIRPIKFSFLELCKLEYLHSENLLCCEHVQLHFILGLIFCRSILITQLYDLNEVFTLEKVKSWLIKVSNGVQINQYWLAVLWMYSMMWTSVSQCMQTWKEHHWGESWDENSPSHVEGTQVHVCPTRGCILCWKINKHTNQDGKAIQQSRSEFIATIIALLRLQADCLFYIIDQVTTLTKKPHSLVKYIMYY